VEEAFLHWSGTGMDLDFCKGDQMELKLICVGGFTCSVRSTLQNAKHEPARGVWGHAPQKIFEKCML